MTDKPGWDYSQIPEREWKWSFEGEHWMDLVVSPVGLNYYGTDWTCQSGGGYFGGFQTFEEFFKKGPIQEMPGKIAEEVGEHLKEYRREGGSTLRLVYDHEVEGFLLTGVSVELNESPIHIKIVQKEGEMLLYEGSIAQGNHSFGYVFVLSNKDALRKVVGEVNINIQDGEGNLLTNLVPG
ncbi:MAG: hypothetical protein ACTSQZ_01770 [Candidatus Thorarchaeota archaeon]